MFEVHNKPSWAAFDSSTGELSGRPKAGDEGSYSNVMIAATDGSDSSQLNPFTIVVQAIGPNSVTVSWLAPTENLDGKPVTDLAGYRIYYGSTTSDMDKTVEVDDPAKQTLVVENLSSGTWYFAVTAFNKEAAESDLSAIREVKL